MADESIRLQIDSEKLDKFLENVVDNIQQASTDIIDELAEFSLDEMQKNYASSEYRPGDEMDFSKTGSNEEKTVAMSGEQAVYTEFGTGTRGEMSPHPLKDKFALNRYNSGPTIRAAKSTIPDDKVVEGKSIPEGELYWTYKDANGETKYTQGIPAQKIVYDAGTKMGEEIQPVVMKHIRRMFEQ